MYLSRTSRHVLIFFLAVMVTVAVNLLLFTLLDPTWHCPFQLGKIPGGAVLVGVLAAYLFFTVAHVWFAILGARVHWGWGCAIILVPLAALFFVLCYPQRSKIPVLIFLGGILILAVTLVGGAFRAPVGHPSWIPLQ